MTFADLLRMHQKRLGMSQKELAVFLGVGSRTVWRWENGVVPSEIIQLGVRTKLESTPTPQR